MPILNKLEYLDETKQQIKSALNTKFDSQITDEDTFRSYVDKINNIYTNWPKVQGEGTNITLNNTKKGRLGLEPTGDLSQETTTGKNSFDILEVTQFGNCSLNNGIITTSTLTDGFKNVTMVFPQKTFVSGHTYYLSADIRLKSGTGAVSKINDYIADWSIVSKPTVSNQFQRYVYKKTFSSDTDYNHLLFQFIVNEGDEAVFEIKDIMISENEDDSYEPYTNGTSPNPDYPQEIKVATGNQNVKIQNKNLNNGINQNIYLNTIVNQCGRTTGNSGIFIPVNGGYYTISTTTTQERYRVACTNEVPTYVVQTAYQGQNKDNTSDSITIDTTGYNYLIVNATDLSAIQIEPGQSSSNHVSHQEQTYPLSLGSLEFAKIGVYKDRLFKSTGKNLFDKNNANIIHLYANTNNNLVQSSEVTTIYIPCKPNTFYAIQKSATGTNNRFCVFTTDVIPSSGNQILNYVGTRVGEDNHTNYTILTPSNANYLCVFIALASTTPSINDLLSTIQIEKSSTASDFEPYGVGKWYKYGAINKVILNGGFISAGTNVPSVFYTNGIIDYATSNNIPYSNYYNGISNVGGASSMSSQNNNTIAFINVSGSTTPRFYIHDMRYESTDAVSLNNWLASNPLIVYYVLKIPVITEITDTTLIEQLDNLYNANSYDDTTIIFSDGDLPIVMNASALMKGGA